MAYYAIEPFGEMRHELRHGQQMALHGNINRDSKQKREPYRAAEFMNFIDKPEPPPASPEVVSAQLTEMFRNLGKRHGQQ